MTHFTVRSGGNIVKRLILTAVLTVAAVLCCNAAPDGWLSDISRAKSFSRSRKLPIIVLFCGGNWSESSVEFLGKLKSASETADFIRENCVPLYVELAPASRWTRDYRTRLQAEFPFLQVSSGIPLPSIYFVDSEFRNLNVREPHFSLGGFKRSIKQAQTALAAVLAASRAEEAAAANENNAESAVQEKTAAEKRSVKQSRFSSKPVKSERSDNRKNAYSTAEQLKEAQRQRKLPRDYKGEPPPGWFTDPDKAREFAAARRLPIVMLFSGTDWCGPCKALHSRVLKKRNVQKMITSECVGLYVNVNSGKWGEIRKQYPFWQSRGVPSMVITDSKFTPLKNVSGRTLWSYETLQQVIREANSRLK